MSASTPLFNRAGDAPLAWLTMPLNGLHDRQKHSLSSIVTARQFLQHVMLLAEQLPENQYCVNLCDNRYLFLVALCATIVRKQTCLLPPNKTLATQARLSDRYSSAYLLHDSVVELASGSIECDVSQMDWSTAPMVSDVPQIPLEHHALISFTSGSTGDSKPNLKTWRTLQESTASNIRYMLPDAEQVFNHLATVPGQHMWGLETSVLMALFGNVCLVDARPLYPQDIIATLAAMPAPRTLISTPLHLRALTSAKQVAPELVNVLVATAPLDQQLARQIEAQFATELREVYGCSEVGSMAVRRTSNADVWEKFAALQFDFDQAGHTIVSADYLPGPVTLEDNLTMLDVNHFRLQGRVSDQINIGGKRGSLTEVNAVLMKFAGLVDGVVIFPPQPQAVPRLVALVVLPEESGADGASKDELREHFRTYLDPAFVPRPILMVQSLPREENGKLNKAKVLELYQTLIKNNQRTKHD